MTSPREQARHVLALAGDSQFQREAAQLQAKALLSQIADEVPPYKWSYLLHRMLRNITLATFELETLGRHFPKQIEALSSEARRLALLWEALSILPEGPDRRSSLLNAAVTYELAGYQANAACLAKRVLAEDGRPAESNLVNLAALFLQRRFLRVLGMAKRMTAQPEPKEGLEPELFQDLAQGTAAAGLLASVQYFLRGAESRHHDAVSALEDAEQLYAKLGLVIESNLTRSLRSLLPVMHSRSLWNVLGPRDPGDPHRWSRYLRLLARGPGADVFRSRSVSELWPSQLEAIDQGLLDDPTSKILRMPTSAGKTRIAEMAIVHTLLQHPGARCVYVAPFRALVSELEQSFLSVLSDLGLRVSAVTGSYETNEFEELLFHESDVLIVTPEKLDLILRSEGEVLDAVQLFVLDEAHILGDSKRGLHFEFLLTRLKQRLPKARFLVASAVIPESTLRDFAEWFNIHDAKPFLTSQWRPAVQRVARFEWRGNTGVLTYAPGKEDQLLREFVPGVIKSTLYEFRNPQSGRINRRQTPELANKSQIAAELALRFVELGPVLIFCSMPKLVNSVAAAIMGRLRLLTLVGDSVPKAFQPRVTRSSMLAEDWLPGEPTAEYLRNGVGVHYGPLPESVRKAVELDFRERKFQVLVATNTLAQGVNLPFKTVIMHSVWRYDDELDRQVRLPARDYWNIAGRAGRAGEETEGLVIHIVVTPQDIVDYNTFLSQKENPEPVQSQLYERLLALVANRLSPEALRTDLDAEILALLVEERDGAGIEAIVQRSLGGTLASVQATKHHHSLAPLARTMVRIGQQIKSEVADGALREVFGATGLSTESCQLIVQHIRANEPEVRGLLDSEAVVNIQRLIDTIVPGVLPLREMQTRYTFAGNYTDLLDLWVRGTPIATLARQFGGESRGMEDFGRFVEDLFGYRLPWGIAGYTRVASHILGADPVFIPSDTKFFPAMVRSGVSDVESCWVAASGVPFRAMAMQIASAFRQEVDTPSFNSFLEWINTITTERLRYEFGLTSPLLEDVARTLTTYGRNSLLREFRTLREFLPRTFAIVGVGYENRRATASRLRQGQIIELERDYDNAVDRNAIAVLAAGEMFGYLPRDVAQVLAPELDTGAVVNARVVSRKAGSIPEVSVEAFIPDELPRGESNQTSEGDK